MQLAFSHGTPYLPYKAGMGALDPQSQQIAGIAATAATSTAGILIALGAVVPVVGPIVAALTGIGIAIANAFSGCGETCVAASNIANQVEAILQQNLDHYLSAPVHYKSLQLAALNNFDVAWQALYKACSNQALLQAGVNCIQDRQQGSCKWRSTSGGRWVKDSIGNWTYQGFGPGTDDASGVCFNWFKAYRDPIANDPTVIPDPTATDEISSWFGGGADGGGLFGTSTSRASLMPALLIGGAAIAALMVIGD